MKIGKVYANTTNVITGEGLLGVVIEAAQKLEAAAEMVGYFSSDRVCLPGAEDKVNAAWLVLFTALKAIEESGDPVCAWKRDDDYWETSCGDAFQFADGGPGENNMRFCPYCGRALQVLALIEE